MPKTKTIYVAETDENGAVLCVWISKDGERSVRPFNPERDHFNEIGPAEFSGAQPKDIKSWMLRQHHHS